MVKPDAGVDVNLKLLRGGLAQPHTRVDERIKDKGKRISDLIKLFRWRKKVRWVDLDRQQRMILLSIRKAD